MKDNQIFRTLAWILPLLKSVNGVYEITGGFAAHLYGATRPINDIDFEVSKATINALEPLVSQYIIYGPAQYSDSTWNLYVMTLSYQGQEIDLSTAEGGFIKNKRNGAWEALDTHFGEPQLIGYQGLQLNVQSKEDLRHYKSKIAYEEEKHLHDIEFLL